MSDRDDLREKLCKIEALFAGAATPGEKAAAGAAAERIELRFSISDPWSRQLFIALCRRYGLRPYRYPRMRRQTVVVHAPERFLQQVLWPEFQEFNVALTEYLAGVTDRRIRDEVYGSTEDAEVLDEFRHAGRL